MNRTTSGPERQSQSCALVTASEIAELLGVPTSWVYEQSRLGRIPTVTLGRYRRYRIEAIEAWIGELESSDGARRVRANRGRPQRAESSSGRHANV